jgi:NTP pyrophosphatase (non-canonical NTP hydrolase)
VNFDEYQAGTKTTAVYPESGTSSLAALSYLALGLAGESGEVANKVKKLIRDGDSPEKREVIVSEIGDALWYISQLCTELGISIGEAARANLTKLSSRKERGVLHGDGDNR